MDHKVPQMTVCRAKLPSKRKTHVASKVAPVSVAVVDVARRWVPVGAGKFVATALTVEVTCTGCRLGWEMRSSSIENTTKRVKKMCKHQELIPSILTGALRDVAGHSGKLEVVAEFDEKGKHVGWV